MVQVQSRPGPKELLRQMGGGNLYREAYRAGMNLSVWLERQDPSSQYPNENLDAFERLMRVADIKTRSDPATGFWADEFAAFDQSEDTRALVPEWVSRQWRAVQYGRPPSTRAIYGSDQEPLGGVLRPYVDAAQARYFQLMPAVPLAELIAVTTPIQGDAYRAFYLTEDATQEHLYRVAEGSELPRAKMVGGDHTIRLHKFGRALEITYETLRRQRIDIVALHIARMAIRAEMDKVDAVMSVITNGDGNSGTAATVYNLTSLDSSATAGTLTLKAWLAFKLKFTNPYAITTALANDAQVLQAYLLNTGTANIPLLFIQAPGGMGMLQPINPGLADNVRIGHLTDAPANQIIGLDRRWAIERVSEIGADISEVERWASRQVQLLTMSEVEGYCVFDQAASKILNIAA